MLSLLMEIERRSIFFCPVMPAGSFVMAGKAVYGVCGCLVGQAASRQLITGLGKPRLRDHFPGPKSFSPFSFLLFISLSNPLSASLVSPSLLSLFSCGYSLFTFRLHIPFLS